MADDAFVVRLEEGPVNADKTCTRCGETKPLDEFHRQVSHGDGRCSLCRVCENARVRRYQAENPEKVRAYYAARERAYREAWREADREIRASWEAARREAGTAASRAWRAANPEKQRALLRAWRAANPDKAAAIWHRRRARLVAAEVNDLTAEEWAAILDAAGGRCAYCGKRRKLTMDHVIPISRGGDHTASNVVAVCGPCNSSKGAGPVRPYQVRLL